MLLSSYTEVRIRSEVDGIVSESEPNGLIDVKMIHHCQVSVNIPGEDSQCRCRCRCLRAEARVMSHPLPRIYQLSQHLENRRERSLPSGVFGCRPSHHNRPIMANTAPAPISWPILDCDPSALTLFVVTMPELG